MKKSDLFILLFAFLICLTGLPFPFIIAMEVFGWKTVFFIAFILLSLLFIKIMIFLVKHPFFYIFSKSNIFFSARTFRIFVLFSLSFTFSYSFLGIASFFTYITALPEPDLFNLNFLLSFILILLPALYLAAQKHFLIMTRQKYNNFLIRFLFLIPPTFFLLLLISPFLQICLVIFLRDLPFYQSSIISLIIADLLLLFVFKKYFIRNDLPPEYDPNFMNHELYVYLPLKQVTRKNYMLFFPGIALGYKMDAPANEKKETLKFMNYKNLENKNLVFTDCGEIIVNVNALSIFSKHEFGELYEKNPIEAVSGINHQSHDLKIPYYQIFPKNTMPMLHPKTKIRKTFYYLSFQKNVKDAKFYYDRKVTENISDFNVTFEKFGSYSADPYHPPKLWVVTKRAMEVLLAEFGQHKRDFIPIMLIDNEKEN
jgi:hypothetical protein